MSDDAIGVVGLGLLGSALAERFTLAGFSVVGYDIDSGACAASEAAGVTIVDSIQHVASAARRIVLSLPDSAASQQVVSQLRPSLVADAVIVDTTTGNPDDVEAIGYELTELGVEYVDATVAGSSEQARRGEVLTLVGGSRAAVDHCRDLLDAFAAKTFYLGPGGSGARMKLVVNLVLGLNRAALAEGLAFARACGIEPAKALEVIESSPAYSRVIDAKGAKMVSGDFAPQARLAQHLKDVRLIIDQGKKHHAQLPLSQLHRHLLEQLVDKGHGDDDNSAVIKAFE